MNEFTENTIVFAINLLWVRPGKVGGTEVATRNLLDGMMMTDVPFRAALVVSKDNSDTFEHYAEDDSRFSILECPVFSQNISKRIMWQNLHLNRMLRKHNLRYCFSPVYDRPILNGGIHYTTVIHDIQAYHYPHYHPFHEVLYSKLLWRVDRDKSVANVAISNFVKDDLIKTYHFDPDKVKTIYNAVTINEDQQAEFSMIAEKYGIKEREYYYTVGQLIPHKNIGTLLRVMEELGKSGLQNRLLISGINGNAADDIKMEIEQRSLSDCITLTGYVSVEERNSLYAHAKAFLFPSVFEGFGIPPIEAMIMRTPVITTKCACIPEVTQNQAEYVDDPYDPSDWVKHIESLPLTTQKLDRMQYDQADIARQYLVFLHETWKEDSDVI